MLPAKPDITLPRSIRLQPLWAAFDADPTTGLAITTPSGQLLHCNAQSARMVVAPDADPRSFIGRPLHDALPRAVADHRLELFEQARASAKPLILRSICRGRQLLTHIEHVPAKLLDDPAYPDGVILTLCRYAPGNIDDALASDPAAFTRVDSPFISLGPLDVLSDRELRVLALIATGLTAKQIAAHLGRSFKTIENHRYIIGRKLGIEDRFALAELARRAGLTVDDATRERI